MRVVALLFGLMGFSCFSSAQDRLPAQTNDLSTIRVSTQLVVLDALVENKKTSTLIDTLQAKDFSLSEDGVPQQITYFSHDQLPLSVVFLFDLTESVTPALRPLAEAHERSLAT
jgi:hypothetical protein